MISSFYIGALMHPFAAVMQLVKQTKPPQTLAPWTVPALHIVLLVFTLVKQDIPPKHKYLPQRLV